MEATVTIASTAYLHTEPVLRAEIPAEGFTYRAVRAKNIDDCTMRTLKGEFDVGEMSLATFFKAKEGGADFLGLPVFGKKFVPQYAYCARGSSLKGPADLKGHRVAVFQYWVTASLWHRWLLKHMYGLDPAEIVWCPLRRDRIEGMPYPEGYRMDWGLLGESPEAVVRDGRVDCFFYARKPDDFEGLRYLMAEPLGECLRLLRSMRFVPINHVMAVRAATLDAHPGLAEGLLKLFDAAAARTSRDIGHVAAQFLPFADLEQQLAAEILGADWNANGWQRNERTIETFHDAACEQGFIRRGLDWRRYFLSVG